MKKCLFVLFTVFFSLTAMIVHAQKTEKPWRIGFGLSGGIPSGDANHVFNFIGGVDARFAYKLGPGFATFTTGATAFVPKSLDGEDTKAGVQVPFKLGYRYTIVPHFFVMGEAGYSRFHSYYEGYNGDLVSNAIGGFTYAPSIGAEFGVFEAAVRYEAIAAKGGTISYGALRVGFNF